MLSRHVNGNRVFPILFPIHVSVRKEHKRMPPSMTTARNYECSDFRGYSRLRAEQNINPSVVQIAIIIDIFQLKREFLGEINDHNEWDGNGKWSQRGFVVGSVPTAEPKIINCYWIPSFHPQSLKGNSPYYNASGTLVTTLLILITTLGLMIQSRLKIINTSKLKF